MDKWGFLLINLMPMQIIMSLQDSQSTPLRPWSPHPTSMLMCSSSTMAMMFATLLELLSRFVIGIGVTMLLATSCKDPGTKSKSKLVPLNKI